MEPESPSPLSEISAETTPVATAAPLPLTPAQANPPEPPETRLLKWAFWGSDGIRAGWSVLIFLVLFLILTSLAGLAYIAISGHGHLGPGGKAGSAAESLTPKNQIISEGMLVIGLFAAIAVMALIERRRLTAYYFGGTRRIAHFVWGLLAGFVALSALVGALYAGHWLTFGPAALSGAAVFQNAALWGIGFLLVALFEEGSFRCYLLFTFARGFFSTNLGFWLAALVSSVLFGMIHMTNAGESWIGIFSAGAIGFIFCMSIRYTGSAWWAIGFHAAWDWAETFFYGTADSGLVAKGHYLTTNAAGNTLWSGGPVGPEGSLLILPLTFAIGLGVYLAFEYKPRAVQSAALTPVAD